MNSSKNNYSKLRDTYRAPQTQMQNVQKSKIRSTESFSMNPYVVQFNSEFPYHKINLKSEFKNLESDFENDFIQQLNSTGGRQ